MLNTFFASAPRDVQRMRMAAGALSEPELVNTKPSLPAGK